MYQLKHEKLTLFQQLFSNHGMSAFRAFNGGTFYALLMRLLIIAFGANTITTDAKATPVVSSVTATTTQPLPGTTAVSVSK